MVDERTYDPAPQDEPKPDPKQEPQGDGTDWKAKAEAAEAEAARLKEADKKRKADENSARKAAEEADAKKRGEFETLLKTREAELEKANAEAESLRKAHIERIDKMIEQLPEAARAKVDAIKDDLPLDKLGAFVEAELSTSKAEETPQGSPPPNLSPGARPIKSSKRTLEPKTYEVLDKLMIDPNMGESVPKIVDPSTGKYKFQLPIKETIQRLQRISITPWRLGKEGLDKRDGR